MAMTIETAILIAWFCVCFSFISVTTSTPVDNDIMRFNARAEPTIDPKRVCAEYPDLNSHQSHICSRYPHATASAMQGVQLAIHECKRQFFGNRWNCSNLDSRVIGSHPILNKGFKETSFTHAITAAGVLHQIARACALGKIASCACDVSPFSEEFQWRGCSHDLDFGAKYSRKFLNSKRDGMQGMMQAHNSKIGRKAVIDQKSTKCKCHGMSSSCEIKTCWLSTPDFEVVGDRLKQLYDKSVQVTRANSIEGRIEPKRDRNTFNRVRNYHKGGNLNRKMVHHEQSPTYCKPVTEIAFEGTAGRLCNSTSTGINSCSTLCCGRGYFTVKVRRVEKCNCKFHWCCYVVCERCEYDEWVTVCK